MRRPVCVVGLGLWGSGASSIICFCSNGCSSPWPIGKRVPVCFVQLKEEEAEVQLLPEDESVLLSSAVQQFSALYSLIIMGYYTSRLGQVCVFLVESKPPSSLCSFSDRFLFSSFHIPLSFSLSAFIFFSFRWLTLLRSSLLLPSPAVAKLSLLPFLPPSLHPLAIPPPLLSLRTPRLTYTYNPSPPSLPPSLPPSPSWLYFLLR